MRNCVNFLHSSTFHGSPSPARVAQASRSAFKAPFISLHASLLIALHVPPPTFTDTFLAAWNALPALPLGELLYILQDPAPMSPSLGNTARSPQPTVSLFAL